MPTPLRPEDGWISSDRLKLPTQELAANEVKGFLAWLFSDLARRPQTLALREAAAVLRHMLWLEAQGVPKKIIAQGTKAIHEYQVGMQNEEQIGLRNAVKHTVRIVWGDLLNFGEFEPSTRLEAQEFFSKHSYQWLGPALKFLEEFDLPPGATSPFHRQQMVGRHCSAQGHGNPYLPDDLSERVAAADFALKRAGIHGRRTVIANALNESKLSRRSDEEWGPVEVRDRVRSYERQENPLPGGSLADKWIASYRWCIYAKEHPAEVPNDQGS